MKNVDDIVKKDKNGLLQMDNTLKPKKFKDFLNAPANLEKLSKLGKDKSLQKESLSNFDQLNEADNWITGVHLHGVETDADDGLIAGWDADWGEMVALGGKLLPLSEYKEHTGNEPIRQEPNPETGDMTPSQDDAMSPTELDHKTEQDAIASGEEVPPMNAPNVQTPNQLEENTDMPTETPDMSTSEVPTPDVSTPDVPDQVEESTDMPKVPEEIPTDMSQDVNVVSEEVPPEEDVEAVTVEDLYGLENFDEEEDARPYMKHAGRHSRVRQKMTKTDPAQIYENYLNWDTETLDDFYKDNGAIAKE